MQARLKPSRALIVGIVGLMFGLGACGTHHKGHDDDVSQPAPPATKPPATSRSAQPPAPAPTPTPAHNPTHPAPTRSTPPNHPSEPAHRPTPAPTPMPEPTPPPSTPAAGALHTGSGLTFSDVMTTSMVVHWGAAVSTNGTPDQLRYKLICTLAGDEDIDTVPALDAIKAPADGLIMDWTPGITSKAVANLLPGMTYRCNVGVRSPTGLQAVYGVKAQTLLLEPGISAVTVTLPEGRASVVQHRPMNITWISSGLSTAELLTLSYSADGGLTWTAIDGSVLNVGTYAWTPEVTPGVAYKIRLQSVRDPHIMAETSGLFAVIAPPAGFDEGE